MCVIRAALDEAEKKNDEMPNECQLICVRNKVAYVVIRSINEVEETERPTK